jgi:hypothetical protein
MRCLPLVLIATVCSGISSAVPRLNGGAQAPIGDLVRAAIPPEALVVVHVGDLGRVRAISQQNSWAALFQDEQVSPFFRVLTTELLSAASHDLPADAPERTLLDPELWWRGLESGAFWIGGLPLDSQNSQGGFMMEFNSAGQALAGAIAASLHSHLTPAETSPVSGPSSEILIWKPSSAAATGGAATTTFRIGNLVGIHFASTEEAALRLSRDAQTRLAAGTLDARVETWMTQARGPDWSGHGLEAGIDLERLLPQLSPDQDFAKFLGVSGLDTTRYAWLGGSLCPGECFSMTLALDVPTRGVGAQVARLFGPAPRDWLTRMPAEATSVSLGHFDVAGAWDLFWTVFGEQAPEESSDVRAHYDGFTGSSGFDLESDLVRQLSGDFGSFTAPVPAGEMPVMLAEELKGILPSGNSGILWMLGLKDSARVEELLERAIDRFGGMVEITSVQYAGAWIQTVAFEGLEFHWTFTPNALIASFSPSLMRGTLERLQDSPLQTSPLQNSPQQDSSRQDSSLQGTDRPNALSNANLMSGLQSHPLAALISVADAAASVQAQFESLHAMAGIFALLGEAGDPLDGMLQSAPLPAPDAAQRHLKGWMATTLGIEGRRLALRCAAR